MGGFNVFFLDLTLLPSVPWDFSEFFYWISRFGYHSAPLYGFPFRHPVPETITCGVWHRAEPPENIRCRDGPKSKGIQYPWAAYPRNCPPRDFFPSSKLREAVDGHTHSQSWLTTAQKGIYRETHLSITSPPKAPFYLHDDSF